MTNIKIEEKENYRIMYLKGEYIGGEETEKLSDALKKAAQVENNN